MSSRKESDVGLPWFEDLVQFKAHLHKHGAHMILKPSRPSDVGCARETLRKLRFFNDDHAEYDSGQRCLFRYA